MAVAFFDFDGTLLRRESGVICAVPSIRRGLLGPRIGGRLIATYLLSRVGLRTRTDAQRVGFECYAGKTLEELRQIMRELHDEHLRGWISEPMRALVEAHKAAGDQLVILTASAFFFAEPIAREFGIDEVIGTAVRFRDERCTGEVDGEIIDGEAKLERARRCAAERGTSLEACTFYSDHAADLPLLSAVGTPVAVGPTRALARVAVERGWRIVRHEDDAARVRP